MKDTQFKKLIKEALTPNFLKEDRFEDVEHIFSGENPEVNVYDEYFDDTNGEYPADTIAREATNINDPEWIRDSFETITDDFGFDKVDLANGIVDGLIEAGFENADLVQQALSMYLSEGKNKIEEDPRGGYADIPTLNKHQDILNLIRNVKNYVQIDVEPDLRGYGGKGEGFYLTTPSLRQWQDTDIQGLKQAFDKTKDQSYELDFELQDTANYEMDPGERSWDAAFSFTVDEKDDGSELYPGTMGDELSAPR